MIHGEMKAIPQRLSPYGANRRRRRPAFGDVRSAAARAALIVCDGSAAGGRVDRGLSLGIRLRERLGRIGALRQDRVHGGPPCLVELRGSRRRWEGERVLLCFENGLDG